MRPRIGEWQERLPGLWARVSKVLEVPAKGESWGTGPAAKEARAGDGGGGGCPLMPTGVSWTCIPGPSDQEGSFCSVLL